MLKTKDGRVRTFILGKLGKHRSKFGLLTADEKRLRARATLAFLGNQAAPAWKQILLDPGINQDIRQLAIYQCPTMPEDAGQMIPAILRLLSEMQPEWRDAGRAAIRRFSPEAALPVLVRQLQDPDRNTRLTSMSAMKYFGSSARPAIPILVQELGLSDKEMALAAADALLSIDAHNVPALVHQMHHAELGIRRVAYWSLAREEAPPEAAVPEFMRGLSDPEPEIREVAAESLAKYGTNARPALFGLTNMLNDEKRYVRRAATNAIESIVVLK
jgi:HEAT repeat protein